MVNYVMIMIADLLFSLQFLMTKTYSRRNGEGLDVSLSFTVGTCSIIAVYMFVVDGVMHGFGVDVTWFSLLLGVVMAAVTLLSGYFSIVSLRYINLSLYSVFMMLGGMLLPAVFGIAVGESLTLGKLLCVLLIMVSLALGIEKTGGGKKGGAKYYFACFFLNGMSGVVAKIHTMLPSLRVESNDFLITYMLISALAAFVLLVIVTRGKPFCVLGDVKNLGCMAGYSGFHGVAQLLSLLTIDKLDVSLQQPLVTGGVLCFSFIVSLILREKQTWKNLLSFVIAVVAVLVISFVTVEVF